MKHSCPRRSTVSAAVCPGPYYPLGAIDTVPRAYDNFRAYEGMKRGKIQKGNERIGKCNRK
jgi:hypothetical protein